MYQGNTWGDKSVDTFIERQKGKLFADAPFTRGYDQHKSSIADEQSRLAAREKFGMPRVGAAKMTGAAPAGTADMSQAALADRLKAIAAGGPTAGQAQLGTANEQAKRALMASAFGKPGSAPTMRTARTVGNQAALMDATAARQASIIGAQEQQAALGQYAGLAGAMRQADIAAAEEANRVSMANAGFAQSAALANQDAAMRWQQMNDQQKRALLGMDIDLNQAEWDNRMARSSAEYEAFSGQRAMKNAQDAATREKIGQGVQLIATTAAMASDERTKTDVRPADGELREMLSKVGAHSYRYKDPAMEGAAPGRHVSPMAQEIEDTKVGRSAVTTGPDGVKRVEYGRLLGAILAGESYLHRRLEKLEQKGAK